jgi:hypothetical protein
VLVSYLPHLNHLSLGQRPVTDYTPLQLAQTTELCNK